MSALNPLSGLARKFSQDHFGAPTELHINPAAFYAGGAAVNVLPNNPGRVAWLIQNRAAVLMGLGFSPADTLAVPFLLESRGGTASMQLDEDGEAVTYAVWIVAGGAGGYVTVMEATQ